MIRKEAFGTDLNIISQRDLARLLGVSVTTVQGMRKDPSFPPRKNFAGVRGWLYRDIVSWLERAPEVPEGRDEE